MLMQARLLNQEMAAINLGRIYTYSDPPLRFLDRHKSPQEKVTTGVSRPPLPP